VIDKIPLEMESPESSIRFRDCFSVRYIQSAALLCRLGYGIEQAGRTEPLQQVDLLRHEAFILNSILSTVAFLECTINELYADVADDAYLCEDEQREALVATIRQGWANEKNFDRFPLIDKYQRILTLAGQAPFSEGDRAYDNVRTLILLRNHLMHYRREWVEIPLEGVPLPQEETTSSRFEKILRKHFAVNPLAEKNRPFFPEVCLGHGCAEWAIVNSIIFTDAFFRKLDLPVPYEGIRDELSSR